ncbi:hypothetical protein FKW77_010841 [Venturia effusa]|uniref:NADH:ubiquinone oxidoreductase intermediate-associated protein 30 domain-containing protein n=1 Tax=Venturia effusa TaxID=50376 RepID=A0A517KYM3_9PEZI|nr:hypothetical protein FKW77_010841 [Venturia effusa]
MQCTRRLMAPPGFWKRSLDEFKRVSLIAIRFDTVRMQKRPFPLITFSEPNSVTLCKTMSDADMGGMSKAELDFVPGTASEPAHAHFHGDISIELPRNNPEVVRTGYAGWRTLDKGRTIWGKSLWDIDPYTFLALRIKSDSRKYFVNIQTDSIVPTDLHQHRLFSKKPGEWETVVIPFNEFVRTNHGQVVEPQSEMLREKVKSVGISLIDRIPKPYSLRIERIWATNAQDDEWLTQSEKGEIAAAQKEASAMEEARSKEEKKEEPEKILI